MRSGPAELGRFSDAGLLVLASLVDGPKHGYAMIADIGRFSGTVLEPGTLYGALARLEKAGWITPLPAEDRRRPYRITAAGETVLRSQLETMRKVVDTAAGRLRLA
jgi:DNA-binding PadR family transcriptional regulator